VATPKRDNERAARALVDEFFIGQRRACEKNGIAPRTLRDYKAALENDEKLAALRDAYLHEAIKRPWADELSETLSTALKRIKAQLDVVPADDLMSLSQLVALTRELMELEMSRMYAEADTLGDSDTYTGRGEGEGYTSSQPPAPALRN
jgi:hypothetical protein